MKERPVLFSAPMVRAILDGRKTQTRRVMKPQPGWVRDQVMNWKTTTGMASCHTSPFGRPGDRIWVKETHAFDAQVNSIKASDLSPGEPVLYCADDIIRTTGCSMVSRGRIRPSIFMPRWASRITLEIVSIRVERLQDISEEDARAEGVGPLRNDGRMENGLPATDAFADLWESINGAGSWNANPWVWVVEFRRIAP